MMFFKKRKADTFYILDLDKHPIYPLTIIQDRYNGIYSGGKFTAWNLYPNELPDEVFSDDVTCRCFWADQEITIGRGNTPDEALAMLAVSLEREKRFWGKNEE
jgi:hypothetical protein